MATYEPLPPPAFNDADVQLDGDIVRVRWFTEGVPAGPGTVEWSTEVRVDGRPEYQLSVKTVHGVGSSWVKVLSTDDPPQEVAQPGDLQLSEMGLGTSFPLMLIPKIDGSSTFHAELRIDGEQVAVFPADGSEGTVLTLDD